MAQETIDFGSYPNDANADPVRTAFQKIQNNFTELYTVISTTGVQSVVVTSGLEQDVQTGNVTISAKISNLTVQTGNSLLVGLGTATGNSVTLDRGTIPIVLTLANTVTTANLVATNSITGTLRTNAQPSITSVGNLTSLNVIGNVSGNLFKGNVLADGVLSKYYAAPINSSNTQIFYNKQGIVDSSSELRWDETTLTVTGNITAQNINGGNRVTANYISGTLIANSNSQPNITSVGTLVNVVTSGNVIATGNISGHTFTGNVVGGTISGTYSSPGSNKQFLLNVEGSVGATDKVSLDDDILTINANVITNNVNAGNLVTANFVTGKLTTANQSNITTVGTLTSLNVSNNTSLVNITVSGNAIFDNNIQTDSLNVANTTTLGILFASNVTASKYTGNGYPLTSINGPNVLGTVANANYAVFAGNANIANYAVDIITASQPNSTKVGNLESLIVEGNITAVDAELGNIVTANYFIGSGNNLSNIRGSNVVGNVNTSVVSYFANVTEFAYSNLGFYSGDYRLAFVSGNIGGTGNLRIQTNDFINFDASTGYLSAPKLNAQDEVRGESIIGTTLSISNSASLGNATFSGDANVSGNLRSSNADFDGNLTANNATISSNIEAANGNLIGTLKVGTLIEGLDLTLEGNAVSNGSISTARLFVSNTAQIGGTLNSGSINSSGSISALGNAIVRNLVVTHNLSSSLIPSVASVYDLGSVSQSFNNLYINAMLLGDSVLTSSDETLNTNKSMTVSEDFTAQTVTGIDSVTTDQFTANNVTINGPISVSGAAVINAGLIASGITSTSSILANSLIRGQELQAYGNLTVGSTVIAGTVNSNNLTVAGNAILGRLTTFNDITTNGNLIGDNLLLGAGIVYARGLDAGANTTVGNITGKWRLTAGSTLQATFADLAEYYAADANIEPGTVVEFGGKHEITTCNTPMSTKVAGVVTTNPAYVMNSMLDAEYAVAVALQGRVPVKVTGVIEKGDMLVSAGNGLATASKIPVMGSVLGKALQNFTGTIGKIEIAVGRL